MTDAEDPNVPPEPEQRLDPDAEADHLDEMDKQSKKIAGDAENDLNPGGKGRIFADSGVQASVEDSGDTDRPPGDR